MGFDTEKADKVVRYFERFLRHKEGDLAGSPLRLEAFQQEHTRAIFGTVNEDGARQYRKVLIEVPRKNGKSTWAAGMGLYLLTSDQERGAQVYLAAGDRVQAQAVYDQAEYMVFADKRLDARCRVTTSRKNIAYPSTASFLRIVSAEGRRQHGLNPHGVIFDELHVQRNYDLWTAMTTGGGTRKQPLIIAITTAGVPSQAPVWWDEHEYARKVREGVLVDPTLYSVFYGADPSDDFEDPRVWRKANPGLGLFMSEKAFKHDLIAAKQRGGTAWNEFLLYRLNVPTAQKDRWLPMQCWEPAREKYTDDDLNGQWCYGGLDLSTRRDITALSWIFPKDDGTFRTIWRFWLPENNVPDHLRGWVRDGYIRTTPGETVDYEFIRAQIAEDSKRFEVRAISYDSWNAQHLANELIDDGHNMVEVRFGLRSMSLPSKEFEAAFVDGRFRHDGNPVARWMADSISVRSDASGNIIPVKPERLKDSNRIDGIVATIMAFDNVVRNPIEGSVYSGERGILFV